MPINITLPGSPFGIAWGMVYGPPFAKAERFLPQIRSLHAGFTKVILFWSQLEPEPGTFEWAALDGFLEQLQSPDEGMLTIYAASPWATRASTWAFPPSAANDPDTYARFVTEVVKRANGRVRYFQNGSEPTQSMFWAGTPEEFAGQTRVFARSVRAADSRAQVVLGASDGLFDTTGKHPLPGQENAVAFFDYLIANPADSFDVFDLHLYADPYTIPDRVQAIRAKMQVLGYERPIIASEYHGPGFFEFPANRKHFALLSDLGAPHSRGVHELYETRASLPPDTQMFLADAAESLAAKLLALQTRDLIIRNVLALYAGVQKSAFWDLWHENRRPDDVKTLLYGKLLLMKYEGDALSRILPLGAAYREMALNLADVESLNRVPVEDEFVYAFRAARRGRSAVYVIWCRDEAKSCTVRLPEIGEEVRINQTPRFIDLKAE